MQHSRFTIAGVVLVLAGITGCGTSTHGSEAAALDAMASTQSPAGPISVESCGREVIFDTPPEKVLAIGSEAPGLLVAAGAGDAVTHYAGSLNVPFGDEVKGVVEGAERVMEDSHDLSFESIISTGVDVAIGTDISATTDINSLAEQLSEAGVELITVSNYCAGVDGGDAIGDQPGFDLIYRDIEAYGKLFGTEAVAAEAVQGLQQRVAAVKEQMTEQPERSAIPLYVNAEGPLGAYGGQALVSEQMAILGLNNNFGDVEKRYFEPNSEEIVNAAPDLVFAMYLPTGSSELESDADVIEELRSRPELAGLDAVATDGAIVPLNYFHTSASPLAVDGLELLADQLAGE